MSSLDVKLRVLGTTGLVWLPCTGPIPVQLIRGGTRGVLPPSPKMHDCSYRM